MEYALIISIVLLFAAGCCIASLVSTNRSLELAYTMLSDMRIEEIERGQL
jgi:uncharacterized integral membrane protein